MKDNNSIEFLQAKISKLEQENKYLKSLLDNANIIYSEYNSIDSSNLTNSFDTDQGARIIYEQITEQHIRPFFSYFWGRVDVFSKRTLNKSKFKMEYYPQCNNFWRYGVCPKSSGKTTVCHECKNCNWTKLEKFHILNHLRGIKADATDVVGIYPLFPDGTCRLLVFDFDNHKKGANEIDFANTDEKWISEVDALRKICKDNNIPCLVERSRSGKGAHVWFFFTSPISASLARKFGFTLLEKGAESINLTSFDYYDRMIPAQDYLEGNQVGNTIALPLQGQALKNGNSAFVDDFWNAYPNQWSALKNTRKISESEINKLLQLWNKSLVDINNASLSNENMINPWERTQMFHKDDVDGSLSITISNSLFIQADNLKPRIQNQIRRLAAFSNPIFYRNNSIGLSNYANSRYIYLGEDDSGYICIPRGLLDKLTEKLNTSDIPFTITDKRCSGTEIDVAFNGQLKSSQEKAVSSLLMYDNGILSAATAFGKTVVCAYLISHMKVNTLILLQSSSLIEQWEKSLSTFLSIDEDPPEYKTKTGLIRKRKNPIGIIHGSKDTSTGIIDIAMVGSLYKKGELHPRLREYGMVIIDECHHSASDTFSRILKEVSSKYVYGVTATPFRGDGLEKINEMLIGPVRFEYSAKDKAKEQCINHYVIPRFTHTVSPHGRDKSSINEAYELIRNNNSRNEQIIEDVKECISLGRTPVILTRYKEHANILYKLLQGSTNNIFLLTGNKSKKEQHELRIKMDSIPNSEALVLIATGQLIGEGFDFPRLDTLIMATPVAWKGIVEQYAGRLNRDYEGKQNVLIYDYIDANIPVFDNMYAKRLKAYKRIGYSLCSEIASEKQDVNAIYDSDTYLTVYEQDLREAKTDIIISSPTLGKYKVFRMIKILQERQESGVKITVVTWHPDSYMYGTDEHRVELMELLRNTGFNIELVKDNCEHYAVIDNEIVWYGSMNLLSKDDVEDNIMRVVSQKIANELLENTFKKGNNLKQYSLPLE